MEQPKYIRIEGFVEEEKLAQIQKFLGKLSVDSVHLEANEFRDRDKYYSRLFENVENLGPVTTEEVLFNFGKNHHYSETRARTGAHALFLSLWGHVSFHHNEGEDCCDLQAGRISQRGVPLPAHFDYINTPNLVSEFQAGRLDDLPVNPHYNQYTDMKKRKTLKESTCYGILPAYIKTLVGQ